MSLPRSWSEVEETFGYLLGRDADAHEWLRQAITARYGDPPTRDQRRRAFQRACGLVYDLAGAGELAFDRDVRTIVQEAIAKRFDGVAVEGPPWRVSPAEDRPTYDEWAAAALAIF